MPIRQITTKTFFKRNTTQLLKRERKKKTTTILGTQEKDTGQVALRRYTYLQEIKTAKNNVWKQPRLFKTFASNTND